MQTLLPKQFVSYPHLFKVVLLSPIWCMGKVFNSENVISWSDFISRCIAHEHVYSDTAAPELTHYGKYDTLYYHKCVHPGCNKATVKRVKTAAGIDADRQHAEFEAWCKKYKVGRGR